MITTYERVTCEVCSKEVLASQITVKPINIKDLITSFMAQTVADNPRKTVPDNFQVSACSACVADWDSKSRDVMQTYIDRFAAKQRMF